MAIAPQQDVFHGIDIHPAATIFPMMDGFEFDLFREDIRLNGQIEPVAWWKGQLLDGRNRYRACKELGIEVQEVDLPDELDPWKYVISYNLHRRHLSETQRAMVAARLANLGNGGDRRSKNFKGSIDPLKIEDAAEQLSVSPKSVKRAKKVLESGTKELIDDCDHDRVTVSKAAKAVTQTDDPDEQVRIARSKERQQIKDVEAQERDAIDSWVRRFAGFENKFLAVKELLKGMDSHVFNMTKLLVCPEDE